MLPLPSDDGVYMKNAVDRNEYILCESGRIWAGAYKAFHIWPWEFEQVGYSANFRMALIIDKHKIWQICHERH